MCETGWAIHERPVVRTCKHHNNADQESNKGDGKEEGTANEQCRVDGGYGRINNSTTDRLIEQ